MRTRITGAELEIMEYLWGSNKYYTFSELLEYFNNNQKKEWCKQTLNTNLLRLKKKGILKAEKVGTKQVYIPVLTQQQYEQKCAEEMLIELYGGKLSNLLVALTGGNKISEAEKEELLEYIKRI